MPRYFFDIHEDQKLSKDEEGIELDSPDEVRREAKRILPDLARDDIPDDDRDCAMYVVLVRAEDGTPVYSATLTFAGLWLHKKP